MSKRYTYFDFLKAQSLDLLKANRYAILSVGLLIGALIFSWSIPTREIESELTTIGVSVMMQAYETTTGTRPYLVVELKNEEKVRVSVPKGFFFKAQKVVTLKQINWTDRSTSYSFLGYGE